MYTHDQMLELISDGLPESQRKADAEFLKNGMEEVKYRHANGGLWS